MNWQAVDLSELLGDIKARLKPVDEERLKAEMMRRVKAFYNTHRTAPALPGPADQINP